MEGSTNAQTTNTHLHSHSHSSEFCVLKQKHFFFVLSTSHLSWFQKNDCVFKRRSSVLRVITVVFLNVFI